MSELSRLLPLLIFLVFSRTLCSSSTAWGPGDSNRLLQRNGPLSRTRTSKTSSKPLEWDSSPHVTHTTRDTGAGRGRACVCKDGNLYSVHICREQGDGRHTSSGPQRRWFEARFFKKLRGGSTAAGMDGGEKEGMGSELRGPRDIKVLVSTTKISSYVDARGEVTARSDWTVRRLREELEQNFPGKIPASLQRLFKGTQLLPSSMTLEEAAEGAEGPLSLLLDNAPPIDPTRFDADTAVPSRRDGQVEAFSACLAAQSCLQDSLLATMRGNTGQDDPELTRSVIMKADFENMQQLLQRTFQEIPESTGAEPLPSFGALHEFLRPVAHRLDVNWLQSAQHIFFVYLCAQFGARGSLRQVLTFMLIPLIVFAQTRTARVGMKLARNLVTEVPVLAHLFLGFLQAPHQVILSMDEAAYVSELYGPGGPKIDPAFAIENEEDADEAVDNDADGEMGTESGTISGLSDHGEESDSW